MLFISDAYKVCVFSRVRLISAHLSESLWLLLSPWSCQSSSSALDKWVPVSHFLDCTFVLCLAFRPVSLLLSLPALCPARPLCPAQPLCPLPGPLRSPPPTLRSHCSSQSMTAATATTNSTDSFSVISAGVGMSRVFFYHCTNSENGIITRLYSLGDSKRS